MTEEDEQLCMSYALGTLEDSERVAFELRMQDAEELAKKVGEFETLYAEQELNGELQPSNTRLKEAIMNQISGEHASHTPTSDSSEPFPTSQIMGLITFGVVIVVSCFLAFGVSLYA